MKQLLVLLLAAGTLAPGFAGTVITANLPPHTAIINIDARADGANRFNGDQSLWYQPFSNSSLPQFTFPPGTYQFRVVNPADAAQLYPALTPEQTSQIYTAWTYNSPWIEDYLVFDSGAATDSSIPQLFDGAPGPGFGNATLAYDDAIANGYYNHIRTGPLGRASSIITNSYTFTQAVTLLFVIPDYGLGDNNGGVSVLVTPVGGGNSVAFSTTNLLVNPGAEIGDLTAWTPTASPRVDAGTFDPDTRPRTGGYDFVGYTGDTSSLSQIVALAGNQGITTAAIDGGGLLASISFWEQGLDQGAMSDDAYISLAFLDGASNVIGTVSTPEVDSHDLTWTNYARSYPIPVGARYVQYTMNFVRQHGSDLDAFVDDNSLIIFSNGAAVTAINAVDKYAYGANFGWIDWRGDTNHGAVIGEYVCSGSIYSANFGWINLGSGAPANSIFYQNNSSNDFGVNQDGRGNLRGLAYGANIGWINFEDTGGAKGDLATRNLSGYAWSADWGWISLNSGAARVRTDTIPTGALDINGLPIGWELTYFGQTGVDPSADADQDGVSNLDEYRAGTNPVDASDYLAITAESFAAGGTSAALTWTSVATRYYSIQKTPSLTSPVWTDSGLGLIAPQGASTAGSFTDTDGPMRFYRVQAVRPLAP